MPATASGARDEQCAMICRSTKPSSCTTRASLFVDMVEIQRLARAASGGKFVRASMVRAESG